MKGTYKKTFGFYIGNMKLKDIRPIDIQKVVNAMEQEGKSGRTIQSALGQVRECMEFAVANRMIPHNPCVVDVCIVMEADIIPNDDMAVAFLRYFHEKKVLLVDFDPQGDANTEIIDKTV